MTVADIAALDALQQAAYPSLSETLRWKPEHWHAHRDRFAPGQLVATVDQVVVGVASSLRVPFEAATAEHSWSEITGNGSLSTHDPDGDTLYGFEIMVHPNFRRRGIGKQLYRARFELVRQAGLRGFVAMGRIPGYVNKGKPAGLSPAQYVERVAEGRLTDRTLTAQMRSGCVVLGTVTDYLRDPKSANAAAILFWPNPDLPGAQAAEAALVHGLDES